ncbi:MAG: sodium/solute symporter [Planctomycetota bacterium]|nr:sodium/solute symporter [Planctomycetota bacterium]
MELHPVDIAIVVLYLTALLLFGLWFGRFVKTEKDYFLAGRSLPFWAIGMSIVVSDIGAIDFVSLSGASYKYGLAAANMDWIGTMPAILLAAFIFIPYYWRAGVYSVPEYFGRRYGEGVRLIQSFAWCLFLVVNLGAIFWASAGMFDTLLGKDFWEPLISRDSDVSRKMIYVVIAAVFTGAYTISGGLAAVVYTDVVQMVIMFLGALLVLGIGLYHPEKGVGGLAALRDSLLDAGHSDHFTLFLPDDTKTPFPWTGVFFGLALVQAPAYFMGNQAIVQRTLGARDEWTAKAGTLFAGFLKIFIPVLVVLPGLLALKLHPDLDDPETCFARLIEDLLPVGVRGIVFAGFLAAMMSSVDSVLSSAATLITRDFCVRLFSRPPGDRALLLLGRRVTLLLVFVGVLMALLVATKVFGGIYEFIQSTLAIVQGPTWALLLIGMFWSRATPAGGLVSLLVGLATAIGLTVWQKVAISLDAATPFTSEDPFMFIAFIAFVVTAGVLVVGSLLSRPKRPEELRGLVFRESVRGEDVQDALRDRDGGEGDAGRDA